MDVLKKRPFFLLLLSLFFCLHGSVENFGSLNFEEVFYVGLSILIVTIIIFLFFYFFSRNILFAALITFFINVWYFFFGAIHDFIKETKLLFFLKSFSVIIPALFVLTILWIIFLKKNKTSWVKLTLYLNVLLFIYCTIDVFKLVVLTRVVAKPLSVINFNYSAVKQKPNVYFLLFDGYPGQKNLTDSFDFSNEKFSQFLIKSDFISLPVMSNYDKTHYSMSSILNMNYVNNEYKVDIETQKGYQARQHEIKHAAVFSIFKRMGYEILNYSIFDLENNPGLNDRNSFLLAHSILLTDKILLSRIRKNIWLNPTGTILKYFPISQNQSIFVFRSSNIKAQKLLLETLNNNSIKPKFCYTHLLMPHEPYYFDSTGLNTDPAKLSSDESILDRGKFISYLKYTNTVAEKMISAIKKKDPKAIIIFMSDHGFRSFPRRTLFEAGNYLNICSVFFPDGSYGTIPSKITNVNTFKYLFNTQFNQQFPFLKDTSFTYIQPQIK